MFDSGPDDSNRIVMFGSETYLKEFSKTSHMACDGTFKACPTMWKQLVTIPSVHNSWSIPVLFDLLPDKKETSYKRMFDVLKKECPSLKPTDCMVDFEIGLQNAIKKSFPNIKVVGCLFHLSQACFRKICDLGLRNKYNNDPQFQEKMKRFPALAFFFTGGRG